MLANSGLADPYPDIYIHPNMTHIYICLQIAGWPTLNQIYICLQIAGWPTLNQIYISTQIAGWPTLSQIYICSQIAGWPTLNQIYISSQIVGLPTPTQILAIPQNKFMILVILCISILMSTEKFALLIYLIFDAANQTLLKVLTSRQYIQPCKPKF